MLSKKQFILKLKFRQLYEAASVPDEKDIFGVIACGYGKNEQTALNDLKKLFKKNYRNNIKNIEITILYLVKFNDGPIVISGYGKTKQKAIDDVWNHYAKTFQK